jgi:hypothetical protein
MLFSDTSYMLKSKALAICLMEDISFTIQLGPDRCKSLRLKVNLSCSCGLRNQGEFLEMGC